MSKDNYSFYHATSKKIEYYVVRFDKKEFSVEVIDSQRHHKDYCEITQVKVSQRPSLSDDSKVREIVEKRGTA